MDGMMIPFIMLLIVTIGLILERKHQEDKIVEEYEEKFEQWKANSECTTKDIPKPKELKGLIFKEGYEVKLELFDEDVLDPILRSKYTILKKEYK